MLYKPAWQRQIVFRWPRLPKLAARAEPHACSTRKLRKCRRMHDVFVPLLKLLRQPAAAGPPRPRPPSCAPARSPG